MVVGRPQRDALGLDWHGCHAGSDPDDPTLPNPPIPLAPGAPGVNTARRREVLASSGGVHSGGGSGARSRVAGRGVADRAPIGGRPTFRPRRPDPSARAPAVPRPAAVPRPSVPADPAWRANSPARAPGRSTRLRRGRRPLLTGSVRRVRTGRGRGGRRPGELGGGAEAADLWAVSPDPGHRVGLPGPAWDPANPAGQHALAGRPGRR
jgi:hypothetical protein